MKKGLRISSVVTLLILFSLGVKAGPDCFPEDILPDNLFPSIRLETSMGDIVVELNRLRAPATSNNFCTMSSKGSMTERSFTVSCSILLCKVVVIRKTWRNGT